MRYWIADKLTCIANWLDGSGWHYDEFDHGYREGIKRAADFRTALERIRAATTPSLDPKIWSMANHALEGKPENER